MAVGTQIVGAGGSIATTLSPVIAKSIFTSGTAGAAASTAPVWAVPVVGAAIAAVTIAITAFLNRKGPKQKVATTNIANEIEPYMQDNLRVWQQDADKTKAEQTQALANFDSLFALLVSKCNLPELGDPGQWCYQDRSRGGKWDWYSYYRDPIANDTGVLADTATNALTSLLPAGIDTNTLLVLGGIAIALMLQGGKGR